MPREEHVKRASIHLIALALLTTAACESPSTRTAVSIADSAGVAIVTSDLRQPDLIPRCVLGPTPRLRIGVAEGDPNYEFGEVSSIALLPDGGIAVLDRQAYEVRIFDPRGEFVRRVGRRGQGPGEFRDPIRVVSTDGDSLLVWDWGQERVVAFDAAGRAAWTVDFRPPMVNPRAWFAVAPGARRFWVGANHGVVPVGTELVPRQIRLIAVSASGEQRDTIGEYRSSLVGWVDPDTRLVGSPIHDHTTSFDGADAQFVIGSGDRPQFEVRDTAWRLVRIVRWREGERAVTSADNETYRQRFLARLPNDAARAGWRPTFDAIPPADSFPTLAELIAVPGGEVWLRRYQRVPGDSTTFWRFASDGAIDCQLMLPAEMRLRASTATAIAGGITDSLGALQVVVFDVRRAGARR
jgi:hypothetical protein